MRRPLSPEAAQQPRRWDRVAETEVSAAGPKNRRSLPGALTIAPGLIGIDFAHFLQEFFGVGLFDLRRARTIASTASTGSRNNWMRFSGCVRHKVLSLVKRTLQISVLPGLRRFEPR